MGPESILVTLRKYRYVFIIILYGVLLFFFLRMRSKVYKKYAKECSREQKLEFDGVISFYYSDVHKETASFCINNSDSFYTIPRSVKAMSLEDGDTIKKLPGSNRYIVKWKDFGKNLLVTKAVDTFDFDCP
jgi:hypothetical protein